MAKSILLIWCISKQLPLVETSLFVCTLSDYFWPCDYSITLSCRNLHFMKQQTTATMQRAVVGLFWVCWYALTMHRTVMIPSRHCRTMEPF